MLRLIQSIPIKFRGNGICLRSLSSAPKTISKPENEEQSKQKVIYKRVYQCREVIYLSIVSKMKIYTGLISLGAFPVGNAILMIDPSYVGIDVIAFTMGTI